MLNSENLRRRYDRNDGDGEGDATRNHIASHGTQTSTNGTLFK